MNNKKDCHVTFGSHFGSHIENMKNAYKQLFHAKIDKTSLYIKYKTSGFILIYCSSEIDQIIVVESLMRPVCPPHGHVFEMFDFREI